MYRIVRTTRQTSPTRSIDRTLLLLMLLGFRLGVCADTGPVADAAAASSPKGTTARQNPQEGRGAGKAGQNGPCGPPASAGDTGTGDK